MSRIDQTFQHLCASVLHDGVEYENKKRGVKRLQIPSYTFKHSFENGFPALSLKKIYWKGVVAELIWFLRSDNDVKFLNENGVTFWNKDAYNWYEKHTEDNPKLSFEEFSKIGVGSVGQNYSVQWRNFGGTTDQIQYVVSLMREDIMSSQIKCNAWNPAELGMTALNPCHSEFQVIGVPLKDGSYGFEIHWNQRSSDLYLGIPLNIASYALLAKILEKITGYKALGIEGTLKCVHFYDNQIEAAQELVRRDPTKYENCQVELPDIENFDIENIDTYFDQLKIEDFKLLNYDSYDNIKVEMLAPKSL